ncbi:hypothetical protein ACHAAC_04315 [Aeromicrobium sp. CF4.19]|uniref:hypothetical protein n=1 Tax=Aeromicrobium sp. CF4.19 TaxID=3373082 RepID=UPI003EE6F290
MNSHFRRLAFALRMKITHGVLCPLTAALALYLVGRLVLPAIDVGVSAGLLSHLAGFLIVMVVSIVHAHRMPRDLPPPPAPRPAKEPA